LFQALRTSRNDFTERTASNAHWIALHNSPVRFGQGIHRATLGFPEEYGLSQESTSDDGCFVVGTSSTHSSNVRNEAELLRYNDLTAVVKIKLDKSSCKSFASDSSNFVDAPDLKKKLHGPMGPAIFYTLDVLHCLARRRQSLTNILLVLLAGNQTN
jgi:hypothetical protein